MLQSILDEPDYRLVRAESADEALLALIADQYALIILDVRLPGMTGFELAQMIKERKQTARVPIIFLTAYYSEDQHILEGYGAGAVDYLHKPVNATILRSKVAVFAELYRKNCEAVASGKALLAEVTERRRADERLRELNETLENRVASRTSELAESQARLKHAADLAKLTYFDLDYVRNRIQVAENFAGIMGFSLPDGDDGDDRIAVAMRSLRDHVVPADRDRIMTETERSEVRPSPQDRISRFWRGRERTVDRKRVAPGKRSRRPVAARFRRQPRHHRAKAVRGTKKTPDGGGQSSQQELACCCAIHCQSECARRRSHDVRPQSCRSIAGIIREPRSADQERLARN